MAFTSVSILVCYLLLAAGHNSTVSEFAQVTYSITTLSECSQADILPDEKLMTTLNHVQQQLSKKKHSCEHILRSFPSAPSGYYQITVPNGSLVQVYCDMKGTNCGGDGGWTRVAYVNMLQSGAICPQGLAQRTISWLTLCGRSTTGGVGCQSAVFSTLGLNYSKVCGQLRGYQVGSPNAFEWIGSIDGPYVDGASITYGSAPRKHIWTYACGFDPNNPTYACPCNTIATNIPPSYVGNDYYCENGSDTNDPLWDGQQCDSVEAPCCTHPSMPWFNKTLNGTTTEDIELRVCAVINQQAMRTLHFK